MKIKAISIWLPWAILFPIKTFETRSWTTNYRGPLLICASKGGPRSIEALWQIERWWVTFQKEELLKLVERYNPLPYGKAVGIIPELTGIYPTEELRDRVTPFELAVGDFGDHRFGWDFWNYRPFKNPFPIKGRQGLFEVEVSAEQLIS
jgi:hypothetical protein